MELAQSSLGEQFLRFSKNYLPGFHRVFLLFDARKKNFLQIFLLRSIKAYLCSNIIDFDSVDFSEHRPEEVISFFWRSVYFFLILGWRRKSGRRIFQHCLWECSFWKVLQGKQKHSMFRNVPFLFQNSMPILIFISSIRFDPVVGLLIVPKICNFHEILSVDKNIHRIFLCLLDVKLSMQKKIWICKCE